MIGRVTNLVRSGRRHDESLEGLRSRVTDLEAALGERAADVARVETDLAAFRIRYRQEVGLLHEELDELDRKIAEAELGELSKLVEGDTSGTTDAAVTEPEQPARLTSDAVRRLFRDVAKTIHPDLADDQDARDRRHTLMVEANRAYALGDEERLRWVLDAWQRSPEAVRGTDDEAMRQRLVRRIAQIEEQLAAYASHQAALADSPLGKLKLMVAKRLRAVRTWSPIWSGA
jgi:hypothetical protein